MLQWTFNLSVGHFLLYNWCKLHYTDQFDKSIWFHRLGHLFALDTFMSSKSSFTELKIMKYSFGSFFLSHAMYIWTWMTNSRTYWDLQTFCAHGVTFVLSSNKESRRKRAKGQCNGTKDSDSLSRACGIVALMLNTELRPSCLSSYLCFSGFCCFDTHEQNNSYHLTRA